MFTVFVHRKYTIKLRKKKNTPAQCVPNLPKDYLEIKCRHPHSKPLAPLTWASKEEKSHGTILEKF